MTRIIKCGICDKYRELYEKDIDLGDYICHPCYWRNYEEDTMG